MIENRNSQSMSEELNGSNKITGFHPIRVVKNFWYSLSPECRDFVAAAGTLLVGGGFVLGISKGYKSDIKIGNHFSWSFGPDDRDD